MDYAKIHNNTLLKYPYSYLDLIEENPHTQYDGRYSIPEWYSKTDEAVATGNRVVKVKIAEQPHYDKNTHHVIQNANPELVDGEWVITWDFIERSPLPETAGEASKQSLNGA